ncbi:MAG: hypothetical protein JNK24_03055 [Alphaproteobacteria bacterium]|nr:hypothetical protein [Alphaproteobacteria bacterium]
MWGIVQEWLITKPKKETGPEVTQGPAFLLGGESSLNYKIFIKHTLRVNIYLFLLPKTLPFVSGLKSKLPPFVYLMSFFINLT